MDKVTKELGEKLLHSLQETNKLLVTVAHLGKQHAEADSPQSVTDAEDDSAPRALISPSAEPLPKGNQEPRSRWEKMRHKWKPTVEFLALLFGIGYALVTGLQWWDANKNFRQDERAWVMVEVISIPHPLTSKEPTHIKFVAKNFGESPALHFRSQTDMHLGGYGCEDVLMARAPYDTESSMPPSGEEPWPNMEVAALPDKCITALEHGSANFVLTSVFTYQDIFHRTHHTHVCSRYEGMTSQQMTTCEKGNDID